MKDQNINETLLNSSLVKGLTVLMAFKGANATMSLTEVANELDMSISSAQRILYTLEKIGFLVKSPKSRKYRLALGVLDLAYHYMTADAVIEVANPFLTELSSVTGETVNLTKPIGTEMIYVARVVASNHIPVHMPLGSRLPMYCTASGRAYLSALPEDEAQDTLRRSELVQHTQWTETDPLRLMKLVRKYAHEGVAYNKEELFLGDMTLAAAIRSREGRPIAAVHIVAPTSRWTLEGAKAQLTAPLLHCARGIANAIRFIA